MDSAAAQLELIRTLRCPACGSPLNLNGDRIECSTCKQSHLVVEGIGRFTGDAHLASFGRQWNKYEVAHDEEDRATFQAKTGVKLEDLKGLRVLDAGCGAGHGLRALRRAYPHASLHGLEWSWPLRAVCALWCRWARVRQGDMWAHDWSGYAMVYLFQRPESMPRAVAKARAELAAGAWLVSLEFEATELLPYAHYAAPGGKMVWIYQAPLASRTANPTNTALKRPPGE